MPDSESGLAAERNYPEVAEAGSRSGSGSGIRDKEMEPKTGPGTEVSERRVPGAGLPAGYIPSFIRHYLGYYSKHIMKFLPMYHHKVTKIKLLWEGGHCYIRRQG